MFIFSFDFIYKLIKITNKNAKVANSFQKQKIITFICIV